MLNFRNRSFAAAMAMAAAMVLTACGGGGKSSGDADVRLVNATLTHAQINLLVNSDATITGTATDTVSAYTSVKSGSPALQVNDSVTGAVLSTTAPTVTKGSRLALVAYESGGSVRTAVIAEDTTAPASGTALLRVFNAATDAGSLDVYVTEPTVDLTTASPTFQFTASTSIQASAFASLNQGTYRIRVTGGGQPSDLRLDIPSVQLDSQKIATVLLTPTTGGTLANGSVLIQEGAYTATRNTNARVRLAAAVSNNATVTAAVGGTVVASGVVSPQVTGYANVPSGAAVTVTVNGAAITPPAGTLAAGADATLLVYGPSGSATASLISDDNHLPSALSNYKIRLVNGITGTPTPLTLEVNFAVVASNVLPGTASSYTVLPSNATTQIDVTSPTSATLVYTKTASIPGNAVFTLFLLGDSGAPKDFLRRDR